MFPIIEVDNEIEVIEYLGTKEKFWFRRQGELHLLKFGREGTGENWAEKIACELCGLLNLPHAHYDLAQHLGRQAVLTPKMNEEGSRLVLGNEIIGSAGKADNDGARFYKYRGHTVRRVIAALTKFTDDPDVSIKYFIGYLLLDAWIGNGDRHNENWGVVVNPKRRTITLAPTFDHASSLGRELSDETRVRRLETKDKRADVQAYSAKARSGLYGDQSDDRPLSPYDAFRQAGVAGKDHIEFWLSELEAIPEVKIEQLFDRIPAEFISQEASAFGKALLTINKRRLLG
ncbi:HipA domain-containing protein [Agrobacterium tumefaciens]|uniref:HipA domain-containing protein n=1 Tax=Agrobacterium tumefaciens TaxID=358 RepID=UPI0021CFE398|nr:HipA domain-containing protein [Agrobacterium tumefaciens]UXS01078.1 phosphatidylinositol kinase [Agrobacterium tumefaciens]